jgi:hypothetical protein
MGHFAVILLMTVILLACGLAARPADLLGVCYARAAAGDDPGCPPTPPEPLGPFYQPNAPVRESVGQGYLLSGIVRSSGDCRPLERAQIEFWLAGPNGQYDEAHRATVFSDQTGRYRFESNFPPKYSFRPPHIHLRVSAADHETLVTQHYPVAGQTKGSFDLVLRPAGRVGR